MRSGISFVVSSRDRQRLRAIVADPKSRQKHVWRARIVLLSGDGLGTSSIMTKTGKSKTCVWRTQPGLPLKKGRGATMTYDYKRNGTTTLFAALNVLDGTVIGQNMARHRHQEFHPLPQPHRARGSGWQHHPRHPRQLRGAQT